MSIAGYDARNTSIYDNVQIPEFMSPRGAFTKIQYTMGEKPEENRKYALTDERTNYKEHVFTANILKRSSNHGGEG